MTLASLSRASTLALLALSVACGGEERTPRGSDERAPEPPATEVAPSGSAEPSATIEPSETATPSEPSEPTTRRERGAFYSITLPAGAARGTPSAPEIVEAVYVLSSDERAVLTVFRPMPEQDDLDAWTTASEGLLEGIPTRHDETEISGMPARVGVFPGELRWTVVADGDGLLFRCLSPDPHDEAWMRARCEDVVESIALVRPIQ